MQTRPLKHPKSSLAFRICEEQDAGLNYPEFMIWIMHFLGWGRGLGAEKWVWARGKSLISLHSLYFSSSGIIDATRGMKWAAVDPSCLSSKSKSLLRTASGRDMEGWWGRLILSTLANGPIFSSGTFLYKRDRGAQTSYPSLTIMAAGAGEGQSLVKQRAQTVPSANLAHISSEIFSFILFAFF